jgi:hypothetical protein
VELCGGPHSSAISSFAGSGSQRIL